MPRSFFGGARGDGDDEAHTLYHDDDGAARIHGPVAKKKNESDEKVLAGKRLYPNPVVRRAPCGEAGEGHARATR